MDGGDASTGTIEYLIRRFDAEKFAEIDSEGFYIYSFPGSMETSALFRPHTMIENGVVTSYEEPSNTFFCAEERGLIFFQGKEPNLRWREYADCILSVASEFGVGMICFIGSVAGVVPHTRAPRLYASISDESLRPIFQQHDVEPSDYEGPASIITYLMTRSRQRGLRMASLVSEIPAYVQGRNLKCIEALVEKLGAILGLSADFDDLRLLSVQFEKRLDDVVQKRPELAELIRKMEKDYDEEVRNVHMAELKEWFERQDIRLD